MIILTSTYVALSCQLLFAEDFAKFCMPIPDIRDGARIPDPVNRLLCPSSFSNRSAAARGIIPKNRVSHQASNAFHFRRCSRTHDVCVSLLPRARGAHCVRLPCSGLTIRENRDVVALDEGVDTLGHVFENAILVNIFSKHAVEDESFPASGSIYGQTRICSHMASWRAKSLRYEVVAWV